MPPSTALCRLPRPDREVSGITALETNPGNGPADDDAASPELALIDSTLRERLALALPAPTPVRAAEVEAPRQVARDRRLAPLAALVALALLVAAGSAWYLLARAAPPATRSVLAPPRVFSWAPVEGTYAYAVEIRRGDVVIYSAQTAEPRLRLPARWVRRGNTFTLSRGTYRWYVWPVRRGSQRHEPSAIVAASFRVGR